MAAFRLPANDSRLKSTSSMDAMATLVYFDFEVVCLFWGFHSVAAALKCICTGSQRLPNFLCELQLDFESLEEDSLPSKY